MSGMFAEERARRPNLFSEQTTIFGEDFSFENELDVRHSRTRYVEIVAFVGVHAHRVREPQDPDNFLLSEAFMKLRREMVPSRATSFGS